MGGVITDYDLVERYLGDYHSDEEEEETMKIQGKAMWACVQSPNTKFESVYCIDVIIDAAQVKEVKKQGLKVKENDNGESFVKIKRKLFRKDGTENPKPKVVDASKEPFTDLIGNGSIVNVFYNLYQWGPASYGSGIGADLTGVQVLDLVEYSGGEPNFEEVDGFRSSKPKDMKDPEPLSENDFDDDISF